MPQDPQTQLEFFNQAVEALGGQRATANVLRTSERNVRYWLSGQKPLHDGILRETAHALIERANFCRYLERRISPAFAENLTARQLERMGKPDARRIDYKDS